MPGAPDPQPQQGWTIQTYAAHNEALRAAQERFEDERDRRYTEVGIEREKALKIKETADLAALQLARDIQAYKDEKANELREQISSERGFYASKGDLVAAVEKIEETIKPLSNYITSQQGRSSQVVDGRAIATFLVGLLVAALAVLAFVRPA